MSVTGHSTSPSDSSSLSMENEELMTSESQRSRQNGRSADRADVGNLSAKDRLSQLRMGGGELTTSELRRSKEEAGVLICWVWTGPESPKGPKDPFGGSLSGEPATHGFSGREKIQKVLCPASAGHFHQPFTQGVLVVC